MNSNLMPYRSFHSQSRVEFIKKKFEGSFSGDNISGSLKETSGPLHHKATFLEKLKDVNLNKEVNLKTENDFEIMDVNKNEGRVFVKRSPAFRKEKLACAKNITRISDHQKSDIFIKLKQESQNKNAKEKIPEEEFYNINVQKDIKRSKTDSDLLKYCSNKSGDKGFSHSVPQNSKNSNSLAIGHSRESKAEKSATADVNISMQYSVVNKKQSVRDKKEAVHLSESIRRALQSPLPKGPPPKKPPRTFCHIPHQFPCTNSLANSFNTLSKATTRAPAPVVFKTDIPKLKSKLEKLEKVIRIHESGSHINVSKKHLEKYRDKIPRNVVTCSVQGTTSENQSCLPISICVSQSAKIHNLRKLSRAKSEFYFDISKPDSEMFDSGNCIENPIGAASEGVIVNVANSEAIYDLPYMNKKNSFETFGKCCKYLKEAVNAKKSGDLHYMCTDVVNQAPKYPNFFMNSNSRKSNEKSNKQTNENQTEILNISKLSLLPDVVEDKSFIMSKVENTKKAVKLKEDCTACNESSEESELDSSLSVTSDSSKVKHKSTIEEEEGEEEVVVFSQAAAQRKIYVSRVSSILMKQVPHWKCKNKSSYAHLFECCLVVGLTLCESKQNMPYIKSVFPPDTKPPPLIESLCFPDASFWPPNSENEQPEEQYYSLVVTNENGERKFGYCRRVLPEGGHVCLPLTYCIISPHRAGGFFYKVLEELESRHGSSGVENFIKQLYESEFPGPGERLKLREILEEATRSNHLDSDLYLSSTLIRRPPDVRLEEKDLSQLFQQLQLPVFLKVFSSLLHERKVLLLSNSLRNLSSCIEALQSILLPFSWQHTYIPVLPMHLIEMCEAPTPYVMGLLKPRNVEKSLMNINFEDGILVDLDESKILKCCGDEGSILPSRFIRDLKTSLHLAMNANDMLSESVRSVLISDAFIRFFVQVCGNYSRFIGNLPSGEKIFQKENFIKSVPSSTKQAFLDWFTETAMFNSFIQDRLHGDDEDMLVKLFSRRAMEYSEESIKDSTVLQKNYRVINRKVKTLGDKIKDFTAFTK